MIGERLDLYVSERDGLTRSAAQKLIESGLVTVNGRAQAKNYRLREGDDVEIEYPDPVPDDALPEDIPIEVVYEDSELLVVNKEKGMVVHPAPGNYTGTLVNALMYRCADSLSAINGVIRPGIVHRLDKDTGGLLLVAKNDAAHLFLAAQLKEHKADRIYHAITVGSPKNDEGTVSAPIGRCPADRKKMAIVADGREAVTHYRVLRRYSGFCYVELRLETGRTHQIRVHMASIGHPLLGDIVYGGGHTHFEKRNASELSGQCLYAKAIGFVHPVSGEKMYFEHQLPDWFSGMLGKLEDLER
ncbi:MAG: RluA family pseudouridine synthase [Clostridia bacterium]|nr:RluA family pseudouridine synthase [Clostridia bacterium]